MFKANSEATPVEIFPGVIRRTLGYSERAMLAELTAAKGANASMHSHANDEIGYVSSGRLLIQIAGESRELAPGDSYCAPAGEMHSIEALEESVCIVVFSPVRKEYLD